MIQDFIQACICNLLHDQGVYPASDFYSPTRQFGFVVHNARGDLNTYISETLQAAWHWAERGQLKRICACVLDDTQLRFRLEFEFVGTASQPVVFALLPEQARMCLQKLSRISFMQSPTGGTSFSLLFEVNLPSTTTTAKNSGLLLSNTGTIPIATLLVNSATRMCVKVVVVP